MKKSTLITVIAFFILALIMVFVLYKSKKFFNENHNSYQTLESNIKVYKVSEENESQETQEIGPQIIEQEPIEFHESPTDVIIDNIMNNETNATENSKETQEKEIDEPKLTPKQEPIKTSTKIEKPKKATITTPKTLEDKNIPKSVLNNPLFRSYVIQVGAFTDLSDAEKKKDQLSAIKFISSYSVQINKTENYYKVMIGFFENIESAKNLCIELKKENVQCFATKL